MTYDSKDCLKLIKEIEEFLHVAGLEESFQEFYHNEELPLRPVQVSQVMSGGELRQEFLDFFQLAQVGAPFVAARDEIAKKIVDMDSISEKEKQKLSGAERLAWSLDDMMEELFAHDYKDEKGLFETKIDMVRKTYDLLCRPKERGAVREFLQDTIEEESLEDPERVRDMLSLIEEFSAGERFMEIRPLNEEERKYTYTQSIQIQGQMCIRDRDRRVGR